MSTPFGTAPQNPATGLPRGEVLGRYESYLDAQKVVDFLADNDFPVVNVSIIGNDLKSVERVTSKLSYPRVAAAGAMQGASFGIFIGLLLAFFNGGDNWMVQILSAMGLGMAMWMIVGVVGYSFKRGKRDFASSSHVMATCYDVVVDFAHINAARALAGKLPMNQHAADAGITPHVAAGPVQGLGPVQGSGNAAAPAAQAEAPPSGWADLPDGRPQFGVRVDAEHPAPQVAPDAPVAYPAPAQQDEPAPADPDTHDEQHRESQQETEAK
ncbi:general stress protein [Paeniglutamicibacter cryotolerans]|uniref:General stress protein 17M-like domain-containing protein n=1 Tax=Paeniglutamicibacter cryotolerans TaxID=670079 RepID=A0A839QX07_9MICC|nr:general stress protein [Paeniglutamicibacter cryotolerans]MBB2996521.1 hypothetical protein [Paeniglutamicibacter cryotolerans]